LVVETLLPPPLFPYSDNGELMREVVAGGVGEGEDR